MTNQNIFDQIAVTVERGNCPIIITAPHGGKLGSRSSSWSGNPMINRSRRTPDWYPESEYKWVISADKGTASLADMLKASISISTGQIPYLVKANFHRKIADVNRPIELGTPLTKEFSNNQYVHQLYHQRILEVIKEIRLKFKQPIILMDIHGQCVKRAEYGVYIGTNNGLTLNGYNLSKLRLNFLNMLDANLCCLVAKHIVVEGEKEKGKEVGVLYPTTKYLGGYTVQTYSDSKKFPDVRAIQFEFGRNLRDELGRKIVSEAFGQAVNNFLK